MNNKRNRELGRRDIIPGKKEKSEEKKKKSSEKHDWWVELYCGVVRNVRQTNWRHFTPRRAF